MNFVKIKEKVKSLILENKLEDDDMCLLFYMYCYLDDDNLVFVNDIPMDKKWIKEYSGLSIKLIEESIERLFNLDILSIVKERDRIIFRLNRNYFEK